MEILKELAESMGRVLETRDAEEFHRLSGVLQNRRSAVREKIQEMTSEGVKKIIEKLSEKESLTDEEMGLVKLWIVGDAESYSKLENNFQDWIKEFKRLQAVLKEHEADPEEIPALFQLQGILADASRIAVDIGYYLEMNESVRRFEAATADPSLMYTDLIVQILKMKLDSPDA